MDQHIHSRLLLIRSTDRESLATQSTTDFTIDFGNTLSRNIKKIAIKNISIPNVFYNINRYNNILIVNGVPYTIPLGQYSITQLITELQTLLVALTFTAVPDPITYKLNVTTAAPATYSSFINGSTIARVVGLNVTNNLITAAGSFPNVYNLSGPKYIFINSEVMSANTNLITKTGTLPITSPILVNAPYGENITYENTEQNFDSIDFDISQSMRTISIKITDENNNILDLNGNNFVAVFKIYATHY